MTSDRGVALVMTLIALAVLSALALGLVLGSATERLAGANYEDGVHALNAADAALELAAGELSLMTDWNAVLSGERRSRFVDGMPGGVRAIGGVSLDLTAETNQLTCGRNTPCTDSQVRAITLSRPWGANNPRWRLFLHGPLASFTGAPRVFRDAYVVVWIGDDAREGDGNPTVDGGPESAGRNVVRVRAEALAAGGARRAVEADLIRQIGGIHVQSWRVRTSGLP